jgi:hypothetical protein
MTISLRTFESNIGERGPQAAERERLQALGEARDGGYL